MLHVRLEANHDGQLRVKSTYSMNVTRCRTMARATPRRAVSCLGVRAVPRIPPAEFFHPPCGLDRLLPASPPRMTRGADGDAERRDRRACGIDGATRAHNRGLTIRGMPSSLHGLLLWRCYGAGCPVWRALRADRDVLSDCLRRRLELTWPSAGDADVRHLRDEALSGGRPMPLVPPVMTTTFPANVRKMSSSTLPTSHQGLHAQETREDAEGAP